MVSELRQACPRTASFMAAMVIDALGSGIWITFSLLYFTYGRGLPLTTAGAALSVGALVSVLAGGLAVGVIVDRFGPFYAATLSCALRAVAFPCYLLVDGPLRVAVVASAVCLGDRLYWAAHGGLVDTVTSGAGEQRRLFALLNSLRNIGLGVGALVVALAASLERFSGTALWDGIPLANAVSFAVAGVLFHRLHRTAPIAASALSQASVSYRGVLANQPFVVFTGATLAITLSSVAFDSILPVYLRSLSLPVWLPPATYALSCVMIPAFQPVALWLGNRRPALALMALAALLVAVALGGLLLLDGLAPIAAASAISALVVVFSLGEAVFGAVVVTVVLSFASGDDTGRYTAFYQLAWGLSGALGPGVHTRLFSVSNHMPWLVLACALLVAAVVYLCLARLGARR